METTPIEVLEHHVEMLENEINNSQRENFAYRNLLRGQKTKFEKAIIELKNIELK